MLLLSIYPGFVQHKNRVISRDGDMQQNRRILIVDDQQDLREQLAKLLLRSGKFNETTSLVQGIRSRLVGSREKEAEDGTVAAKTVSDVEYEVDIAGQGEEAFEMVKKAQAENRPYAIMFTDMRMPPGWDGLETARRVRQIDHKIEIVIMTAFADHNQREIAETIGLPHKLLYIKKPFQSEEIYQLALALTSKWNFEETEQIRKEWLETLLRCLSKVKTINSASINDIYSTILKSLLSFTGSTRGFIASWAASGDWELRDASGLEWSEAQDFIRQNVERLRDSKTTQQLDGKYILPLKRETFSAVVCIYDVVTQSDPEWYKMISLLVMTSSEVLCNSVMSSTMVRRVELNHLDLAVKKVTELESDLLDRIIAAGTDTDTIKEEITTARKRIQYIRDTMDMVSRDISCFPVTEVCLGAVLQEAAKNVGLRFNTCRIDMAVDAGAELKTRIAAEPLRFVLETLLTNSCEAVIAAGRNTVGIKATISEQKNFLGIHLLDDGPGIPETLKEEVFEPFATVGKEKVGIGLSASRIIMEKMQGGLFLDLAYRNGASFNLKLVKPQQ